MGCLGTMDVGVRLPVAVPLESVTTLKSVAVSMKTTGLPLCSCAVSFRSLSSGALSIVPHVHEPPGLLFHASFDKRTVAADFATGEGRAQSTVHDFRFAPGVKGEGLLLQPGQRYVYPLARNLDTSQGTFSCWLKPLNWEGRSKKFRHTLVVTAGPHYTMLVYLYPIGDEAVFQYIHVGAGTPSEATWKAESPVDVFRRGQWTHVVSTWDAKAVRLYANGRRVGEGLVASPLPKLETGTISICPIDFWGNKEWGDPAEQTVCDEVRIFGRPLADDEILDLYAADAPAGAALPAPALVIEMTPHHAHGVRRLDTDRFDPCAVFGRGEPVVVGPGNPASRRGGRLLP